MGASQAKPKQNPRIVQPQATAAQNKPLPQTTRDNSREEQRSRDTFQEQAQLLRSVQRGLQKSSGRQVLLDRDLLSTLLDYLDPNDANSLNMFFASKGVFQNLDVVASRIKDSGMFSDPNTSSLVVDTGKRPLEQSQQSRGKPISNPFSDTPVFIRKESSDDKRVGRVPTMDELTVQNTNMFDRAAENSYNQLDQLLLGQEQQSYTLNLINNTARTKAEKLEHSKSPSFLRISQQQAQPLQALDSEDLKENIGPIVQLNKGVSDLRLAEVQRLQAAAHARSNSESSHPEIHNNIMTPSDIHSGKLLTPAERSFYSIVTQKEELKQMRRDSTPREQPFTLPEKLKRLPKEITDPAVQHANLMRERLVLKDLYVYKEPEYLLGAQSFSQPKQSHIVINVFEFAEEMAAKKIESLATSFRTDSSIPVSQKNGANQTLLGGAALQGGSSIIEHSPKIVDGGMSHYHRVQTIRKTQKPDAGATAKVPNFVVQPSEEQLRAQKQKFLLNYKRGLLARKQNNRSGQNSTFLNSVDEEPDFYDEHTSSRQKESEATVTDFKINPIESRRDSQIRIGGDVINSLGSIKQPVEQELRKLEKASTYNQSLAQKMTVVDKNYAKNPTYKEPLTKKDLASQEPGLQTEPARAGQKDIDEYMKSQVFVQDQQLQKPLLEHKPTMRPPLPKAPEKLPQTVNLPEVVKTERHVPGRIQLLPSGAYATSESSIMNTRGVSATQRRNTVFSLAALESISSKNGFRSGVFGLKSGDVMNRSSSVQRVRPLKPIIQSDAEQARSAFIKEINREDAEEEQDFDDLSIPLLRRQFISKRAHQRNSKMQSLDRKQVIAKPLRRERIDELFEHNMTVQPIAGREKKKYTEEDISHFKNIVLQLICKGQTEEVHQMLGRAPSYTEQPGFTDAQLYKFTMFKRDLGELLEDKVCSPLAIAASIGDPRLVGVLLENLHGVDIEFGLSVTSKSPVHTKANMFQNQRRRTPLQYACSLGLFQIVARLLKEGANPNLVSLDKRKPHIDYGELPLDICINPKHQGHDLSVEGLTFVKKYNLDTERDFSMCEKLLLEYGADLGLDPGPRLRESKKRPTPIFQAIRSLKSIQVALEYLQGREKLAILERANHLGKTPLVMVAEGANSEQNEQIARLLLKTGLDPKAGKVNPLMAAIREKNYRVMRVLNECGVQPDSDTSFNLSPVQFALQYNDPKLLEEILQWQNIQIDLGVTDNQGRNIFHLIAQNQDSNSFDAVIKKANYARDQKLIIKQQLNRSLDPSQQPYLTPLYFCFPNKALALKYIQNGADPSQLSFLHCFFTLRPNFDYLSFLIKEVGLDVEESDVQDKTAIGLVYSSADKTQIQFLVQHGAQIDRPQFEIGKTILMDAAEKGDLDMFQFLLKMGASKDKRCTMGRSVQDYIKMDAPGKSMQVKQEMNRLIYRDFLFRVATGQ